MPCSSGRALHNLCVPPCLPLNCCASKNAFTCRTLCPCPELLSNTFNLNSFTDYCDAFTTIDPGGLFEFFEDTLTSIGENIDTININLSSIPSQHCQVVIEIRGITNPECIAQTITITNKIITSSALSGCTPTGGINVYINNTLCLSIPA